MFGRGVLFSNCFAYNDTRVEGPHVQRGIVYECLFQNLHLKILCNSLRRWTRKRAREFQLRLFAQITTLFNDLSQFFIEDRMLRTTYLYENIMFTNIVRCSIIWGGKGKDIVTLIKSLTYVRVKRSA